MSYFILAAIKASYALPRGIAAFFTLRTYQHKLLPLLLLILSIYIFSIYEIFKFSNSRVPKLFTILQIFDTLWEVSQMSEFQCCKISNFLFIKILNFQTPNTSNIKFSNLKNSIKNHTNFATEILQNFVSEYQKINEQISRIWHLHHRTYYDSIQNKSKCAALDTPCATRVSVHAKNRTLARNVEKISLVCSREISGMQGPHLLSIAPTRLTYTRTRSQACCAPRATSSRIPFPSKVHTNGICCTPVPTYVGIITIY